MLKPEYTTKFKKDLKTIEKRNLDLEILKDIMRKLCLEEPLPVKNKDHNYRVTGPVAESVTFLRTGF